MKLTLLILFLAASMNAATVADIKHLSEFGTTNAVGPGTLISVSTDPGTVNEKLWGLPFTNLMSPSNLMSVAGNYVVVIGDSRVAETNAQSGIGTMWPTRLMSKPNWAYHTAYYNFGVGGTSILDWTNTLYAASAHTLAPATIGGNGICIVELGLNDIGGGPTVITNRLTNLWTRIRADGYRLIATTIATSFTWTAANAATGMAVNASIRGLTNFYDGLLDWDRLITNSGQMKADGFHYNAGTGQNLADYAATNIVPPYSGLFASHRWTENPTFDFLTVSNVNRSRGMHITGPTLGLNSIGTAGLYLDYDDGGGNSVISSHHDIGGFYLPLYVRGAPTTFDQGLVAITGGPLQIGSGGYISNTVAGGPAIYFATNTVANNGSIYLDPNGILWKRTNSAWVKFGQ